jgi:hypothetical protein
MTFISKIMFTVISTEYPLYFQRFQHQNKSCLILQTHTFQSAVQGLQISCSYIWNLDIPRLKIAADTLTQHKHKQRFFNQRKPTERITIWNLESIRSLLLFWIWKKIEYEGVSHEDLVRDNNHHQLEGKHTKARIISFLKSNFN